MNSNEINAVGDETFGSIFFHYNLKYKETNEEKYMRNYSSNAFERKYNYKGNDLGAKWKKERTIFRVWAPTAEIVLLNLYQSGNPNSEDLIEQIPMKRNVKGTWRLEKEGDLNGIYYTYSVLRNGEMVEAADPYAKAAGVNGLRSMVIDLSATNPEGWEEDKNPHDDKQITDAIIYELHLRDLSIDESSGIQNKGKFLALTETGTKTSLGHATGLDYLKELGITHLHLLPVYDYGSVDEAQLEVPQYNWGYDPTNYNIPEGSYATDPFHGEVRVKEMKQMIKTLHDNGISVIMDVVYNHVYDREQFCFNKIVPGYFSRMNAEGAYSNGSGCGNDTASERFMVKKYIVESVYYWTEEYHIDGFRFDLVGLLDTETINELTEWIHASHPDIIFYGEGWGIPTEVTKEGYMMATQQNSAETPVFAYFNDTIRDGLKGSVFQAESRGYATGNVECVSAMQGCLKGQTWWTQNPSQIINYASCHDNYALMDKISLSIPEASEEEKIRCNNLCAAMYLLSQGVPFLHAGEEMLRSKVNSEGAYIENSYNASDLVNSLKWNVLEREVCQKVLSYYKGLISLRKKYSCLRYMTAEEVEAHVQIVTPQEENVIAVHICDEAKQEELFFIFNSNKTEVKVSIPEGRWKILVKGEQADIKTPEIALLESVSVEPISTMVLEKSMI